MSGSQRVEEFENFNDSIFTDQNEACFVYTTSEELDNRPKKRRKTKLAAEHDNSPQQLPFVPLLGGKEAEQYVKLRSSMYHAAWDELESALEGVLQESNTHTIDNVVDYLMGVGPVEDKARLNTGLISTGLSGTNSNSLFPAIQERLKEKGRILVVDIPASQCVNLKNALKYINHRTTDLEFGVNEETVTISNQSLRLLNYDLQTLYCHVTVNSISRVILYFQNSEALDGVVLADLIDVIGSWQDKIPLILVFETATSIELFQEKLPRAAIRRLRGTSFLARDPIETLELMFRCGTSPTTPGLFFLGASVCKMLMDRQIEYAHGTRALIQALKYIYMTLFFVNPLSVLLGSTRLQTMLQHEHYEALRNIPSFRRYVEDVLKEGDLSKVRRLLDDDSFLHETANELLQQGRESIHGLFAAMEALRHLQSCLASKAGVTMWSKLYIQGLSGELVDSTLTRELLLSARKIPSDAMAELLNRLSSTLYLDLTHERNSLTALLASQDGTQRPLRSEHDISHQTLRTTVVAQKVELSKHKAALSKEDTEYSAIVTRVSAALKTFFEKHLIHPKNLCFHEIFLFDLRTPCRDVFAPHPQAAIERALSVPHDYLGCECCDAKSELSPMQPPTAILYQLYLESGALINIADLWSAFNAILGSEPGEGDEEEEDKEEQVFALFYRALAELKYLGMIKNSTKKADHLVKLMWEGL